MDKAAISRLGYAQDHVDQSVPHLQRSIHSLRLATGAISRIDRPDLYKRTCSVLAHLEAELGDLINLNSDIKVIASEKFANPS